jgi:hypothetical protein
MWNLDDQSQYEKVPELQLPWATTYADTREGFKDKQKREKIREQASGKLARKPHGAKKWAFRILVSKSGRRAFDIENVGKLIIDAFCERQIQRDGSNYTDVSLYPDDSLDHVTLFRSLHLSRNSPSRRSRILGKQQRLLSRQTENMCSV